ncbi:MAG TPA: PP2C family protein-serine/threonine phosphatase [Acidobacteriota bacterium]|nr:PP2C family protein-serine/threonine phosphatase [Acidobacteriota bacterium]
MKRVGWLLMAALGAVLFALLFWRGDESRHWQVSIDRTEAVRRAFAAASDLAIEVQGWKASVAAESSQSARLFRRWHPEDPLTEYVDALRFQVRLDDPASSGHFQAEVGADGSLRQFQLQRPTESEEEGGEVGISASAGGGGAKVDVQVNESVQPASQEEQEERPVPDEIRAKAQETLEYLMQGRSLDDLRFSRPPGGPADRFAFQWAAPASEDAPGELQIAVVVGLEEVLEGEVEVDYSRAFEQAASEYDSSIEIYSASAGVLASVLFVIGTVFFLLGSLNREIHHRTVLSALLVVALLRLLTLFPAGAADNDFVSGDALWEVILQHALLLLFLISAFLFVTWGPAYMLLIRKRPGPVVSADLFLRGGWLTRPVGQALAAGIVLGPTLAAAPYLAAAIVPGGVPEPPPLTDWAAPMIWLSPFDLISVYGMGWVMLVFGLWYSLMEAYVERAWVRRTAQLAMATACLAAMAVEASLPAALLAGLLAALAVDWLYQRQGLLAVVAMMVSAYGVRLGAGLLQQPSESLYSQGIWMFSALALLGLVGLVVSRWGRPVDVAQESRRRLSDAQRLMRQRRAERDKLLAEFSVAKRAQQMMLPESPPRIPGYQLAGLCQPAREVGGDLYDFLPVDRGQWAVAVADVAGKGLEASLYMTLTKGLLTSVSGQGSDPAQVLRQVNGHYFKTAPRDKFVTLLLGMIDPDSGRLRCASAGHNSPIWRRAAQDETLVLKEVSGLALGLADGRLFDRSVTVKDIDLGEGDALFFYSDGIPEAMNKHRQEYGEERLCRRIAETDGMSAEAAMQHILRDMEEFVAGHPASDDVTLVVLRRENRPSVASEQENRYTEELSHQAM